MAFLVRNDRSAGSFRERAFSFFGVGFLVLDLSHVRASPNDAELLADSRVSGLFFCTESRAHEGNLEA